MDLSNLKPAKGSVKKSKRIGRGQGSGKGGTSTRGSKGAGSRSGYKRKLGFEGGQMALHKRVPKFGFTNINRKEYRGINLDTLQKLSDKTGITIFDLDTFLAHGLASKNDHIKILRRGEIQSRFEITAHAFSASAVKSIESKGGIATKIS
jgi:large subunit ribosomal protein L15